MNTITHIDVITVDSFCKLTGQETLHPQVCLADLAGGRLPADLRRPCSFYALTISHRDNAVSLINPGEMFEIPAAANCNSKGYIGVIFHPDLLCSTPLESRISKYHGRHRYHKPLTQHEQQIIADILAQIRKELIHAIDRYSSTIIASHIELLLNYCSRFCSNTKNTKHEEYKH